MLTKAALEYLKLGTGGSYSLARDAIAHRIWDTRSFSSTAQSYTFFSQPVGAPWVGGTAKTLNETNLYTTASLPNGQTFLANRIGLAAIAQPYNPGGVANFAVDAIVASDMKAIIQNSVIEIRLAGREYDFQAHGRQLLTMPISSMNDGLISSSVSPGPQNRIGDYIASGWIKLDPTPIFIDQVVTFQVVQRLDNPIPAIKTMLDGISGRLSMYNASLMVILDGFLTRAK